MTSIGEIKTQPNQARCPRILYVITDLEVGGVPLHLYRLALHVRDVGYQPTVVSLRDGGPVAASLREAGIPVESCEARSGWDIRVFKRLGEMIREHRPDVIHSFLFHANLAARWAAKRVDFQSDRVVCEIQTVEVERRWHLWVDRWTHDGCRFTIGNSPSVVEHLARHAHIPSDRLRLIRGGIDVSRIDAAVAIARSALGVAEDAPIILWVGRLDPSKGLMHLIESFRTIVKTTKAQLLLVGDGPLRGRVRQVITKHGLEGSVHLPGTRNDVPSLLKSADVFAFPSRTEGLPNALLEAMAAGCPIVTTDVPGCRDLIQHEQNGLLVPYGGTRWLGEAIERLLSDWEFAGRLGRAARRSVEEQWGGQRMYAEYLAVYSEIVER